MKLKVKLAEEYQPNHECLESLHVGCLTKDAFLAGFEIARSIAANIAYNSDFDGTGDEIDYIGEEEVK